MVFAAVNFMALFEKGEGFTFKWRSGLGKFFGGVTFNLLAFEMSGGGFEDGYEPFVGRIFCDFFKDGKSLFWREPRGSDGGVKADAGGLVRSCPSEEFGLICDLVAVVAKGIDSGGADLGVFGFEKVGQEGFIELIEPPRDPEGFKKDVVVAGHVWLESGDPFFKRRYDFLGIAGTEFASCPIAGAVFGEGEIVEEGEKRCAVNFGGLNERAIRVGDAVDAAVFVVTEGVAGAVLHVAD